MKKLKKNLISVFIFLLLIALTVVIYYLLPYEKALPDQTIFFGVVASEVITLLGTLFYHTASGKKRLPLIAGGYTILFGYQVLIFILSTLFALRYRNAIATYKIIFACFTGACLLACVLVYFFGRKVAEEADNLDHACRFFHELEYKTEKLCSFDCEGSIHGELKKIDDAVKNCDHSICVNTDEQINDNINCLLERFHIKEMNSGKILELCENTICLIRQRNAEACKAKLGGV